MLTDNIILDTDSYKHSHYLQYPPGTEFVYSYIEPRGGKWDDVLIYGTQIYLKKYLSIRVTHEMVDEAVEFFAEHGEPFNEEGWRYIVDVHGGRLPVSIKTVREGTIVKNRNVVLTIVNTDPKCFWITSFLETALLRAVWYPSTVATNSLMCKRVIQEYLEKTADDPETKIGFALHDFGARGVSSKESAGLGGSAHLINFLGTDTVEGVIYARRYYGCRMAGFSIPAAEHSTITSWLRPGEVDAYRNMLRKFARPGSLVAIVSDSYDLFNAVEQIWGTELRQHVIDSGATVVIRPDSGDPRTVPVECVKILAERFGYTVNAKGYKVLKHVKVIQGDGINIDSLRAICENLMNAGFSIENCAFGMGGGLLQQVDRDTLKWAMKCSALCANGEWREVFKDPITDQGKQSKRGRLALVRDEDGGWATVPYEGNQWRDELVQVYRDGEILKEWSFDEVRAQAARG